MGAYGMEEGSALAPLPPAPLQLHLLAFKEYSTFVEVSVALSTGKSGLSLFWK